LAGSFDLETRFLGGGPGKSLLVGVSLPKHPSPQDSSLQKICCHGIVEISFFFFQRNKIKYPAVVFPVGFIIFFYNFSRN
jgi:hypothetical protein